jgi:FkbM family methyltransferase
LKQAFPEISRIRQRKYYERVYDAYQLGQSVFGFNFYGPTSMHDGSFEPEEVKIIKRLANDIDLFIDIGANIGYYSCMVRAMNKKVISVEPLRENLNQLYKNLLVNEWTDVEVLPIGLSSQPGLATLFGSTTGASLIQNWAGASDNVSRTISLSRMDDIFENRLKNKSVLIKIDVEGVEFDVLNGAQELLSSNTSVIWIVEICLTENFPDGHNNKFIETFEFFWSNGYSAYSANEALEIVHRENVEKWVMNKKVDFGNYNYIFSKERPF